MPLAAMSKIFAQRIPLQAGIDAHLVGPWLGTENRITIRQRSLLFLSYIVVILPKTAS
jgi:hypothetical protein